MVYEKELWLKSYDPDVSPEIGINDDSIPDRLEKIRKEFGDRPALHFLGVTLTYEELMSHADRFAAFLANNGIGKGDVIAVSLPNCPQYVIAFIGGLKAGCAVTGVSPLLTAGEIAYQLKDSGATAMVIMDALFEHRLKQVADDVPDLKHVCVTGLLDFLPKFKQLIAKWLKKVPSGKMSPVPGKNVVAFMDLLRTTPESPPNVSLTPDDPFVIQYTGGTTGLPKGAVLSHGNMLANVTQFDEWFKMNRGVETVCSAYPMFHIAGLLTAINSLAFGCEQVLIPNPRDTKTLMKQMAVHKPHWIANVPSLYLMLLREPGFAQLDFSRLRVAISSAAPCPVEGLRELERVLGEGKVIEMYGMTETSPLQTMNPYKGTHKIGSVGIPISSTRIRIVDLMTGENEVPLGEEGEIVCAGPQVMKGYHNRPEETAGALREHDGEIYMHTGDIGRMDEDGYVFIVDRAKDMISVGGFKVFPREIEDKLFEHPAVDLCAMVGIVNPDRPETELVKLVVQKSEAYRDKPDTDTEAEILAYAKEHFAPYKVPKIVEFKEVPLTPAGKVDKKALR